MNRKAFICKSCEAVYADALVSQCDCMPEKNEFIEAVICSAQPEQEPSVDWQNIGALMEAHSKAKAAGLIGGTTSWGAFVAREMLETAPQRQPLTEEMRKQMKEASDNMEMRGAFANGWLSAEAAHDIGKP